MPEERIQNQNKVITRTDLFDILNRLEARVHGLQKLIEARIEEQNDNRNTDDFLVRCSKSKLANFYINAIFRTHVLMFSFVYTIFTLGIILILESIYMAFYQLQIVLGILAALDIIFIITTCLVSIE